MSSAADAAAVKSTGRARPSRIVNYIVTSGLGTREGGAAAMERERCGEWKCMGPGSWVMLPRCLLSMHGVPFARCGRAVTAKERFVVRGNKSKKKVWQVFVV